MARLWDKAMQYFKSKFASHQTGQDAPLAVRHPTQADSPPREPGSDQVMAEAPDSPPNDNTNQAPTSSGSQANGGGGDNASKVAHSSAGSSWNNKKFQEEYQRAESQLTDQNWDHRKYGDPLMQ